MDEPLFDMRMATLRNYGFDRLLVDSIPDPQARAQAIEAPCHAWANAFDPYSLVVLARAAERFDVRLTGLALATRELPVTFEMRAARPQREQEAAVALDDGGHHDDAHEEAYRRRVTRIVTRNEPWLSLTSSSFTARNSCPSPGIGSGCVWSPIAKAGPLPIRAMSAPASSDGAGAPPA